LTSSNLTTASRTRELGREVPREASAQSASLRAFTRDCCVVGRRSEDCIPTVGSNPRGWAPRLGHGHNDPIGTDILKVFAALTFPSDGVY